MNATGRAVAGLGGRRLTCDLAKESSRNSYDSRNLLLVGHDAFPAGAQNLLLNLARELRKAFGVQVEYLLLAGGSLEAEYAAVTPGKIAGGGNGQRANVVEMLKVWADRGFHAAAVNTAVAAWVVPLLHSAGIQSILLIHEMPRLIHERDLLASLRQAVNSESLLIFPARSVRDRIAEILPLASEQTRIMPQGIYRMPIFSDVARVTIRSELGIASEVTLVLGAGYADLRKGFDLFLQTWRAARRLRKDIAFCWVGAMDPVLRNFLGPEIAAAEASGTFYLPGYQSEMADWYSAADLFALSSREDPFPSVVLEAIAAGLPVAAYDEAGGIPELLREHGCGIAVPMADATAMAEALVTLAATAETHREMPGTDSWRARRRDLAELAHREFDFSEYARRLLHVAQPGLLDISVFVPNYNHACYLPARLASIFGQTYPVREVVLLDDGSTDDSLRVGRRIAADWQRDLTVLSSPVNSGSVFAQWQRSAELARGEFIWIAEADDDADADLLAALAAMMQISPNVDLAFCDSRSVDAEGVMIWPSYQEYYRQSDASVLERDGIFAAKDFARRFLAERNLILNVSAVLWRRAPLLSAIERCRDELTSLRLAGDWRIYAELMSVSAGQVAYVAAPLNIHRRHKGGVTQSLEGSYHAREIGRVQRVLRAKLQLDERAVERQDAYLRQVSGELETE